MSRVKPRKKPPSVPDEGAPLTRGVGDEDEDDDDDEERGLGRDFVFVTPFCFFVIRLGSWWGTASDGYKCVLSGEQS